MLKLTAQAVIFIVFAERMLEWLASVGLSVDQTSFFAGVLVTVLFGAVRFWFTWLASLSKPFKPQSVVQQTSQTPAQIVFGCLGTLLVKGILSAVLIVLLGLLLFPNELGFLLDQVGQLVAR
ncbi:MAG: hypothetical protein RMN25_08955 [Anaerolineae bacterium]|nr:hypothetical protein [Thermoflexales bacterium]MDW8407902.1 hypothetical protein [Anaerolineae bacterium]